MFIATSPDYGACNVLTCPRAAIEPLRAFTWYCPSCQQPVILKNGTQLAPHFAHRRQAACLSFSEGESEEHLRGKALLARWCEQAGLAYELEAYLPELQQRPDLLIGEKLAIEFQCSRLPVALLAKRTANYQAHGYTVIWLLGSAFFLKKQLSQLQRASLSYSPYLGFYFWQLNVQRRQLRLNYFLEEVIGSQRLRYLHQDFSCGTAPLLEVLSFPEHPQGVKVRRYSSPDILMGYLAQLPSRLRQRHQPTWDLQEAFYTRGTHLNELSNLYFLPVTRSLLLEDEVILWRWQVWQLLLSETPVKVETLWQGLSQFAATRPRFQRPQPLIPKELSLGLFLTDYLLFLRQLKVIAVRKQQIHVLKVPGKLANLGLRQKSLAHYLTSGEHISAIPHKTVILL